MPLPEPNRQPTHNAASTDGVLLSVRNLSVDYCSPEGRVSAARKVSLTIGRGRTVALLGESGSGKTTVALSIMRLIPPTQGKILTGSIVFDGIDLPSLSARQLRQIRGNKIAMVFQELATSLNPVLTVGAQIAEAIAAHLKMSRSQAWSNAVELLGSAGLADAAGWAKRYPHEFSSGMQQRAMIAMALACNPQLLIADEPTASLDVITQAHVLDILQRHQARSGMSILLITHDLSVAARYAHDVAVMYASKIVEIGAARDFFKGPLHPYSQLLLKSVPSLNHSVAQLPTICGDAPEPLRFSAGCEFHPRCPVGCSDVNCQTVEPELRAIGPGRCVACRHAPGFA